MYFLVTGKNVICLKNTQSAVNRLVDQIAAVQESNKMEPQE